MNTEQRQEKYSLDKRRNVLENCPGEVVRVYWPADGVREGVSGCMLKYTEMKWNEHQLIKNVTILTLLSVIHAFIKK